MTDVFFDFTPVWRWSLLALLLLPLLAWWVLRRRARPAVTFSDTYAASTTRRTLRSRLWWLPTALRLLAIAVLIVALAGPREGRTRTSTTSEGIAIQLLIDRSQSMRAMDFRLGGQPVDRLTAVKDVATRFVAGDGADLPGRDADLVGVVGFASFADSMTPLTLDHDFVSGRLAQIDIAGRGEDATAIGDAIGLGVERLRALERSAGNDPEAKLQGKVMILLTDGDNTAGILDPLQAAQLAANYGVRIYTIGVGSSGLAPMPVYDDLFGRTRMTQVRTSLDEAALTEIANTTGGRYFRATDTASLESIYEAIDAIETTQVNQQKFTDHKLMAIQPVRIAGVEVWPLVVIAMGLVAADLLLGATWLRRAP